MVYRSADLLVQNVHTLKRSESLKEHDGAHLSLKENDGAH